jgi:hypothetical protein
MHVFSSPGVFLTSSDLTCWYDNDGGEIRKQLRNVGSRLIKVLMGIIKGFTLRACAAAKTNARTRITSSSALIAIATRQIEEIVEKLGVTHPTKKKNATYLFIVWKEYGKSFDLLLTCWI